MSRISAASCREAMFGWTPWGCGKGWILNKETMKIASDMSENLPFFLTNSNAEFVGMNLMMGIIGIHRLVEDFHFFSAAQMFYPENMPWIGRGKCLESQQKKSLKTSSKTGASCKVLRKAFEKALQTSFGALWARVEAPIDGRWGGLGSAEANIFWRKKSIAHDLNGIIICLAGA